MKLIMKICGFILMISLLSGCGYHSQVSYSYTGNVKVTLGMGNRNLLVEGKKVPVEVVISGDYAAENHKVALTVPTNGDDYYCYRKAIRQSGEETVVFLVPVAAQSSQMVVEILNEKDQVIYSRTCSYQFSSTEGKDGEIVIGMTGVPSENHIWNFASSYGEKYYLIRTVKIQPENLLTISGAYDSYSMMVIHTDIAAEITDAQMEAIRDWTARGGSLLFLGGSQVVKELGFSLENRIKSTNLAGGGYVNGYQYKAGIVWIMGIRALEREMDEGEQLNLLEVLLSGGMNREAEFAENRRRLEAALIDKLEWQGSIGITADRDVYPGIFCVYLVVVIPGIYLLLRRKDRMHLFRICICTTACLVSLIIWIAGSKTRFSKPFLHSISISSYDQGSEKQSVYISVQAPYNQGYEVSLLPDYNISALQKADYWSGTMYNSYDRQTAAVEKDDERISLKLGNMTAFTPQYFELNREIPSELGIDGFVGSGHHGFDSELTNCMGANLHQVAILIEDRVILLELWKNEETIDLQEEIQSQRARVLSVEQFLEGGYRSWEKWGSEYGDIYELILERESYRSWSRGCVMARRETAIEIQYDQNYQQKEVSLIVAGIELETAQ